MVPAFQLKNWDGKTFFYPFNKMITYNSSLFFFFVCFQLVSYLRVTPGFDKTTGVIIPWPSCFRRGPPGVPNNRVCVCPPLRIFHCLLSPLSHLPLRNTTEISRVNSSMPTLQLLLLYGTDTALLHPFAYLLNICIALCLFWPPPWKRQSHIPWDPCVWLPLASGERTRDQWPTQR